MDKYFINENLEIIENAEQERLRDENNARQEEEKPISALDLFEKGLTKSEIKAMAAAAIESVLIKGNPLTVAEALSAMELFIKEIKDRKEFKDYVREEAGKTPKGFISNSGAKIEVCETGTKYDYSQCNDPILKDAEEKAELANGYVKSRQEFLKKVPESGIDFLLDDEVVKIYPPSKSSTSSYKITLAK